MNKFANGTINKFSDIVSNKWFLRKIATGIMLPVILIKSVIGFFSVLKTLPNILTKVSTIETVIKGPSIDTRIKSLSGNIQEKKSTVNIDVKKPIINTIIKESTANIEIKKPVMDQTIKKPTVEIDIKKSETIVE